MRDVLLVALFGASLPFALRFTWAAVLLWTWVSIMNPHKLTYGFAFNLPFAMVAALAAAFSLMVDRTNKVEFSPPLVTLLVFIFWMCVSTMAAFNVEGSTEQLIKIIKIQLMTLVATFALKERKHMEYFIWVNVLSIGFFGFKGGLFTITTGGSGRVWGPPGGFIEGNNELALATVVTIPLINYLRIVAVRPLIRHGLTLLMLLCIVSALGSQSRGALLASLAMGAVLWTRSSKKGVAAVAFFVVALALLAFMPDSWQERMGTMQTYQQDGSAMGRINAWYMTWNLAVSNFFGGGFAIYSPAVFMRYAPDPTNVLVAHSIYFSVLGEHGFVGLGLFLLMWGQCLWLAQRMRKLTLGRPELTWVFHLAGMCQVAIVGYAVGGAFLSLAYFDLPYNVLVMLSCAYVWLKKERWRTDAGGAFGSTAPTQGAEVKVGNKRGATQWS